MISKHIFFVVYLIKYLTVRTYLSILFVVRLELYILKIKNKQTSEKICV